MAAALGWVAACAFAVWISFRKPGRPIYPHVLACVFLATFAVVVAGAWVVVASPTLTGDAGRPIRSQ